MRYIASCSGGKDSVAMVLELIRRKYPLDAVITVDLGAEFKSIYEALGRVSALCAIEGIPFRTLRPEHDFRWYFAEKPVREKGGGDALRIQLVRRQMPVGHRVKARPDRQILPGRISRGAHSRVCRHRRR